MASVRRALAIFAVATAALLYGCSSGSHEHEHDHSWKSSGGEHDGKGGEHDGRRGEHDRDGDEHGSGDQRYAVVDGALHTSLLYPHDPTSARGFLDGDPGRDPAEIRADLAGAIGDFVSAYGLEVEGAPDRRDRRLSDVPFGSPPPRGRRSRPCGDQTQSCRGWPFHPRQSKFVWRSYSCSRFVMQIGLEQPDMTLW